MPESRSGGPIGALSKGRYRSVRRLSERKGRESAGAFVAEGPQALRAALELGPRHPLLQVIVTPLAAQRHADLVERSLALGVEVISAEPDELAALTDSVTPQGVVAVCAASAPRLADVLADGPRLLALCHQVRDPGNAGTIIRSADAFGADAVVFTAASVELHNPKVVRATVGSLFNLPVVTGVGLAEAVAGCRAAGLDVLAASGHTDRLLTGLGARLRRPTAWLFGNEAHGLSVDDAALADDSVAVPIFGRAESLNLASAAAVCLYTSAAAQRG